MRELMAEGYANQSLASFVGHLLVNGVIAEVRTGPNMCYRYTSVPLAEFQCRRYGIKGQHFEMRGKKKVPEHRSRRWLIWCSAVLACVALVVWSYYQTRAATRWLVWSRMFKSEVLSEPTPANGELKHIDWDGWGWAGQNTTVFLVFDPTDSLSAAATSRQSGKFSGIPCEVYRVSRLENHWYTAQFYTGEYWGQHNELDCTSGSGSRSPESAH